MLNQNTYKVIYSLRVYLQLVKLGFCPISTTPNPNDNHLMCWIFEKTPEFSNALTSILKEQYTDE